MSHDPSREEKKWGLWVTPFPSDLPPLMASNHRGLPKRPTTFLIENCETISIVGNQMWREPKTLWQRRCRWKIEVKESKTIPNVQSCKKSENDPKVKWGWKEAKLGERRAEGEAQASIP